MRPGSVSPIMALRYHVKGVLERVLPFPAALEAYNKAKIKRKKLKVGDLYECRSMDPRAD